MGNLLQNAGFESGATVWTGTAGPITNNTGRPARTGSWKAWLGGNGSAGTETINQSVAIPSTVTAATLSFWLRTDTAETGSTAYDRMRAQVVDGSTVTTLATYSNVGHQRHVHAEVVQPHGLQGQDGDDPVHDDRGLEPADLLRRRRHGARDELTRHPWAGVPDQGAGPLPCPVPPTEGDP